MSVLNRGRNPAEPVEPGTPPSVVDELSKPVPAQVPRTRMSGAWLGICTAVLGLVILIVFMLQNTGSVAVNFLWMNGSVPLALALFIAGVATAVLATTIGAARMTQLRRLVRHRKS